VSEADDTSETPEGNPIGNWSEAIHQAHFRLFRELTASGRDVTPQQRDAVNLVEWLARVFDGSRDVHPQEAEILGRIKAAQREQSDGDKAVKGEQVVKEHAERYLAAGQPGWLGNSKREIAQQLVVTLWSDIDEGFGKLSSSVGESELSGMVGEQRLDQVCELLDRYKTGRNKRLQASGLLAKLNDICGKPLGKWSFSAKGVANARKRKERKASPSE
jgi:hypothetical protein